MNRRKDIQAAIALFFHLFFCSFDILAAAPQRMAHIKFRVFVLERDGQDGVGGSTWVGAGLVGAHCSVCQPVSRQM